MATNYPFLPGVEVNIADGGLILPEDSSTESMLIIAACPVLNAPQEPTRVSQSSDLLTQGFGNFIVKGKVNELAAAWKQAFEGGCKNIYLMALPGATDKDKFTFLQDSLFGILADYSIDNIVVVGVFADKPVDLTGVTGIGDEGVINSIDYTSEAVVLPLTVDETNSTIVLGEVKLTLTAGTYDTLSEIKDAVNLELKEYENELNGVVKARAIAGKIVLESENELVLGDETTALGFAPAAKGVAKMEGNFAKLLGEYAENQTINLNSTVAFIGTSRPQNNTLTSVKEHVEYLTSIENSYTGYLQVVGAPELSYILPGRTTYYSANGCVSYAALVSRLDAHSATTNKQITGVAAINYKLSMRQLNNLTANKFVTFRMVNNQVVVTDGITSAPDYYVGTTRQSSDYTRLSTLRVTQAAASLIRELTAPYIGEANEMPQYNSLYATIKSGLESMVSAGALQSFNFSIQTTGATLNEATITLQLVPALELKRITLNVSLTPPYATN